MDKEQMTELQQQQTERLRKVSGEVDDTRPLVVFFYLLMRETGIPLGTIEDLVHQSVGPGITQFTNGFVARYAQDIVERLNS